MIEPRHISILKEIALNGGTERFVKLSTFEVGRKIGISQQSASRWLKEITALSLIERRKSGREIYVKITKKGIYALKREFYIYIDIFKAPKPISIKGNVISGIGEGKYYVMKHGYRTQIIDKLFFDPYPGTLNVKVEPIYEQEIEKLRNKKGIIIDGFIEDGRKYGKVFSFFCIINGYPGALIIPEMSNYANIVEIIADTSLREKIKLRDESRVSVDIYI